MSNTVSLFVAPAIRKALTIDTELLSGMLSKLIGLPDNEYVTPKMLHSNKDSARAGMGAKMTPVSFLSGLTFLSACYANGQGNAESLAAGLPAVAAHAFNHAVGLLSIGRGVTAKNLRMAVVSAMGSVAALPTKSQLAKVGAVVTPLAVASGSTVAGEIIAAVAVAPATVSDVAPATVSDVAPATVSDVAPATVSDVAPIDLKEPAFETNRIKQQGEFINLARILGIVLTAEQRQALGMRQAA